MPHCIGRAPAKVASSAISRHVNPSAGVAFGVGAFRGKAEYRPMQPRRPEISCRPDLLVTNNGSVNIAFSVRLQCRITRARRQRPGLAKLALRQSGDRYSTPVPRYQHCRYLSSNEKPWRVFFYEEPWRKEPRSSQFPGTAAVTTRPCRSCSVIPKICQRLSRNGWSLPCLPKGDSREGLAVARIVTRPVPFAAWCKERNLIPDQRTRLTFSNEAARHHYSPY
jgi:hypothetical protein